MKSTLVIKVISAAAILLAAAYLYDSLSLDNISPKGDASYIRIGYINLHTSKVSAEDLKKLETYNCDLWLFLEWNGDNLLAYDKFSSPYIKSYEFVNKDTYGVLVLARKANVLVQPKNSGKPAACNYPLQLIRYGSDSLLNIYLAHAPPPVPSCQIKTANYLNDLLTTISYATDARSNILIGDLNTLPFQASVKKIKDQGFSDAQRTLGLMPQGTFSFFPWLPKLLKIDYVFYKGEISPKQLARFSLNNSDHSGWVADFQLLPK